MAKVIKRSFIDIKRVARGWGYELWIENEPEYCGKILHVEKGKRGSFHFHMNKKETMFLQQGHLELRFSDIETGKEYVVDMLPGDSLLIEPGTPHQIIGIEESDLLEFSTFHEETDSYKISKGD